MADFVAEANESFNRSICEDRHMSVLKRNRLLGFKVFALSCAVLAGWLIYMPSASAQCYICAGGINQFCQNVNNQGMSNCADGGGGDGNCVTYGSRCLFTIAEDGSPVFGKCPTVEDKRREALGGIHGSILRSENNLQGTPSRRVVDGLNKEEIRKLEEMKLEVAEDAEKGLMPSAPVDYIKLFQSERRDEVWASRVETYMGAQLAKMPLAETGLSKPIVQCASSVCEVAVVQDATTSQNLDMNWQAQFFKFVEREGNFLGVIDSANFATSVSQQKNGFVSYVSFDR